MSSVLQARARRRLAAVIGTIRKPHGIATSGTRSGLLGPGLKAIEDAASIRSSALGQASAILKADVREVVDEGGIGQSSDCFAHSEDW